MLPWKRPVGWWLRNPRYLLFQAREVGGVFTALYALVLLWQLRAFGQGEIAYAEFLAFMGTPGMFVVNVVMFAFVLVHAITWFALIGKAQPVQFTKEPLPWQKVFAGNLVAWVGISAVVLYLIFGGI